MGSERAVGFFNQLRISIRGAAAIQHQGLNAWHISRVELRLNLRLHAWYVRRGPGDPTVR